MLFITDEREIDLKRGVSVIYFYTPSIIQHHQVYAHLNEIEDELSNVKFYSVDVEAFPKQVKRHRIPSLPFIRIYQDEGYVVKFLVKMDDILNGDILRDIDKKYNQGELHVRGRRRTKTTGAATTVRTTDSGTDMDGYSQ